MERSLGVVRGGVGLAHLGEGDPPGVVGALASRPRLVKGIRETVEYGRVDETRDVSAGVDVLSQHPSLPDRDLYRVRGPLTSPGEQRHRRDWAPSNPNQPRVSWTSAGPPSGYRGRNRLRKGGWSRGSGTSRARARAVDLAWSRGPGTSRARASDYSGVISRPWHFTCARERLLRRDLAALALRVRVRGPGGTRAFRGRRSAHDLTAP